MGYYDVQLVCIKGHQINHSIRKNPERNKAYCSICGEKTIYQCPNCNTEIRGKYYVEGVVSTFGVSVPKYCDGCGEPYPWANLDEKEEFSRPIFSDDTSYILEHLFKRFHLIVKQLRHRHNDRGSLDVDDEYDVQDLLHALLRLFFNDIRTEEWTPSYAGKSSRMDFLLKDESIVIEVKKTRKGLTAKELGDQLIIDIERYQQHPDCEKLFCFVYDPEERIVNPRGVEKDLSRVEDNLTVDVLITP